MNTAGMVLTSIAVVLLSSCEHSVDEPTGPAESKVTFDDIHDTVFTVCLPCHSGGTVNGGLDLSRRDDLIDTPSNGMPGIAYIRPAKPDSSYIYLKVIDDPGIVGTKMPPTGSLPDDGIATLRDWILDGAP